MNSATFTSKIDGWLFAVLAASALASLTAGAYVVAHAGAGGWATAAIIVLLGCVLPLWLMRATRYVLTPSELRVQSGPFRWIVPLREIRSVTPTRSPLSSPALSLDRLRIEYGQKAIMISPRDRERFLRELDARRTAAGSQILRRNV